MSKASLDMVRERFDREADSFDAIYRLERSPISRWFNTTFRKAIFQRYEITFAQAGDVTGKSVLDIGCGSGVYSVDFARRGARRVLGVDFARNMLDIAQREAEEHNVSDICEFVQADFLEMNPDEKFDISIAMGVFDYLPDPVTFLRKMLSVTSGKATISFPGHSPVRERLRRLRYRLLGKGNVFFYSYDDVKRIAREAGMCQGRIITIRSSGGGYILISG